MLAEVMMTKLQSKRIKNLNGLGNNTKEQFFQFEMKEF